MFGYRRTRRKSNGEGEGVFRRVGIYSPDLHICYVRGSYRDDFFFVVAFFIRTAAFFAGFFLAILGHEITSLKKMCKQFYPRLSAGMGKS